MTPVTFRAWLLCIVCLSVAATAGATDDSLYTRLGGDAGVAAISTTLIDRVVADPVICDLSGGPCHYSGDPMKEVHAGHHITEAMFYRMVATLRDILRERHVDQRSTNQLLRLLAPMKRDVVEHGSAPPPAAPAAGAP